MQVVPPVPQAWFVLPARQVLPLQQPVQLAVVHTHVPLEHCVPLGQVTQVTPPVPQYWFESPVRQLLPSQQPLGQLAVVHTHEPF